MRRKTSAAVGTAAVLWAGAALLAGACTDRSGRAQEDGAVVPSDPQVAVERADRARILGSEDAPVRIVEISDFQCPFCAQYFRETFPSLDSAYIRTGRVNYVWISFPNPNHARAWPAIEAAFCAGAAGQFWPMHDLLFERQEEWTGADDPAAAFARYAAEIGIDEASFEECTRQDRMATLQVRDYQGALRAGITSTPFFILADSVAIRGAAPFSDFVEALDGILEARGAAGG